MDNSFPCVIFLRLAGFGGALLYKGWVYVLKNRVILKFFYLLSVLLIKVRKDRKTRLTAVPRTGFLLALPRVLLV